MQTTIGTKQKIFNVLQQNQSRLSALGVKRIGLFGSFVRGEQRTDSDIDLLVEFEPTRKTFDTFMELSFFQMQQYKIPILYDQIVKILGQENSLDDE
jgi:predicted nucleotidyltransferase